MKYVLIYLMISFNISAQAATHKDLVDFIKVRCDFFNEKIKLDDRLDCMTDYINCTIGLDSEIDLKKADGKCLNKKAKERQNEQLQN